jgi:hypothetical protein
MHHSLRLISSFFQLYHSTLRYLSILTEIKAATLKRTLQIQEEKMYHSYNGCSITVRNFPQSHTSIISES